MELKQEPRKKKKIRVTLQAFILAIVISLIIGVVFGQYIKQNKLIIQSGESKIQEVFSIIEKRWLDISGEIDLEEAIINGMVSGLNDKYSTYFTPEKLDNFTNSINQKHTGIGISFNTLTGYPLVTSVYLDSGAFNAGIQIGDIITKVNGLSIENKSNEELVNLISGESNTTVVLTILRNDEEMVVEVIRSDFDATMTYEIKSTNEKSYGLITITSFGNHTTSQVEKAMADMKEKKIDTIVFDLRDNPGGYLGAAQGILNLLIEKDQVMFYIEDKNGKTSEYKSTNEKPYRFVNGYILMNHNSASSSEILAGVLQEVLDYQIIGEQSYGKGVAQDQITLNDLSVLKLTTSKWLLPSKTNINNKGLTPNIEISNEQWPSLKTFEIDSPLVFDQVDERIIQLQVMLKILGYTIDREDGYFNQTTLEALMQFETNMNLEVNGQFDATDKEILVKETLKYIYTHQTDLQIQKLESLI